VSDRRSRPLPAASSSLDVHFVCQAPRRVGWAPHGLSRVWLPFFRATDLCRPPGGTCLMGQHLGFFIRICVLPLPIPFGKKAVITLDLFNPVSVPSIFFPLLGPPSFGRSPDWSPGLVGLDCASQRFPVRKRTMPCQSLNPPVVVFFVSIFFFTHCPPFHLVLGRVPPLTCVSPQIGGDPESPSRNSVSAPS